jgi:PAS domain S-box-containing protein
MQIKPTPPVLHDALRHAVENLPLGVTVADTQGKILFTNPAEAAMHGWRAEDLLGMPTRIFHPPWATRSGGPGTLKGVRSWTRDRMNCRRDGSTFPVRLRSTVLLGGEGEPAAVITVSEDRSVELETPDEVNETLSSDSGVCLAGEWALGVAHDFNNILTVVGGLLEVIVDSPDRGERRDLARMTQEQVGRAQGLVRWLQDVSRTREPELVALSLSGVVDRFANSLARLLPVNLRLAVHHSGDAPLVRADAILIQQALLNLVTNARDAMPSGGVITIATSGQTIGTDSWTARPKKPSHGCVTVTDTGTGIDPSDRERIFDPFYTTKQPGRGSGLGLAFVRSVVDRLEGHVHVESTPGRGTTISLNFPAVPDPTGGD